MVGQPHGDDGLRANGGGVAAPAARRCAAPGHGRGFRLLRARTRRRGRGDGGPATAPRARRRVATGTPGRVHDVLVASSNDAPGQPRRRTPDPAAHVTVLVVAFGMPRVDLSWLPRTAPVVVVENDHTLGDIAGDHRRVTRLRPGRNLGFGQGVMFGLQVVDTPLVLLCNPDTCLQPVHWDALVGDADTPTELRTVPLVDPEGRPTSVTNAYPGPVEVLLGALRAGRLAPRGGRVRQLAARLLGQFGAAHRESLTAPVGRWPLATRWVSGAVLLVATDLLRQCPFHPQFFLYYEDVDLCRRLSRSLPDAAVVVVDTPPARHAVGGSARDPATRRLAQQARIRSAAAYAATQTGIAWQVTRALLAGAQTLSELLERAGGARSRPWRPAHP